MTKIRVDGKNSRVRGRAPLAKPLVAPEVFQYSDFRRYLKDVIQFRKLTDKGFNRAKLAKAMGFSSHAGLVMILTGKRELRSPYLEKCVKFLKLNPRERLHFETMARSSNMGERARVRLLKQVELLTSKWEAPADVDSKRLIDHLLIQQILNLYRPVPVSVQMIYDHFRYEITKVQIVDSLHWLKDQELADTGDGLTWFPLKSVFMLKDEIPNEEGKQLHKDFMKLASVAMDKNPVEDREFQTYIVSINSQRIGELKQWIKKAALEIAAEFEDELDADTLIEFHFNMFEVINRRPARGSK